MPRADARRNRESLLTAAKEVFGERGPDAPLDEIARRAGLGNATMYRHFPTRRDMLVAVYADEVTALAGEGRDLLGSGRPADALCSWLRTFVAHVATKRDLAHAIPEGERTALFAEWHATMHETLAALLERAQEAGAVRPDVHEADLLTLANGMALAGADPSKTDRLIALVRTGMEPR
ncbi:TetR/AcrR family transcriptional regulator [Actinomadura fibrosa]|uniref:TetR/AcrR family transcriptional regulator n=1 Tax=Actinomadura fibrosa TaxID=111802 RepID=A0ABW2XGW1_9ACTN|nr:TetR/AcrR family transcriptional regulator [Actinomadura fibrosa]